MFRDIANEEKDCLVASFQVLDIHSHFESIMLVIAIKSEHTRTCFRCKKIFLDNSKTILYVFEIVNAVLKEVNRRSPWQSWEKGMLFSVKSDTTFCKSINQWIEFFHFTSNGKGTRSFDAFDCRIEYQREVIDLKNFSKTNLLSWAFLFRLTVLLVATCLVFVLPLFLLLLLVLAILD